MKKQTIRLFRILVDGVIGISGVAWIVSLYYFAVGTMDSSNAEGAVLNYQLLCLGILLVSCAVIAVCFKIRIKLKEKIDDMGGEED